MVHWGRRALPGKWAAYGIPSTPAIRGRDSDALRVATCAAGGAGIDVEEPVLLRGGAGPLDGSLTAGGEHLKGAHRE